MKEKLFADTVFNDSRSMITVINRDYKYEKANKAFCDEHRDITGPVVGKSLWDIWGGGIFLDKIKNNIDICFAGESVSYEASFRFNGSEERFFQVSFLPFRDENGEITHVIARTSDITDRKLAEKEAAELRKEYTEKARNYEERLLQAQRLETIGSLAGGIAHDFNNILATIAGYAEMLDEDLPQGSPSQDKTAKILAAVYRARSLTEQIIAFSRSSEIKVVPVNVGKILTEALDLARSSAPDNIRVIAEIPGYEVVVHADQIQLFRVFLNIITNALQAMEAKGGILRAGMELIDSSEVNGLININTDVRKYVRVYVNDTGEGMDPAVVSRIFEPFYTTREVGKGTGLGLSVAYGIVSEMGGEILVSSTKLKGSLFGIYLPAFEGIFSTFAEQNE